MTLIRDLLDTQPENLAELAANSIQSVWQYLGQEKRFHFSSQLLDNQMEGRADRLIHLTKGLGDSRYINALNGQSLYEKTYFAEQGVELLFINPFLSPYAQGKAKEFIPGLSMIDVLMWNTKEEVNQMLTNYSLE